MLLKTPDEEKAARLLDDAAITLEKYGWVKGALGSEDDGFCLLGAIRHAAGLTDYGYSINDIPNGAMITEAMGFDHAAEIWAWNDQPKRKEKGVLRRLRKAARWLREKILA